MSENRWTRIDRLLQSALDRPPEEREAFIRGECADDEEVRDEVLSLLAHEGSADKFLEPQPARQPLLPGARLGAYEIRAQIGEGGMGEVYRAYDSRLRRDIALKILPPDAADAARRQRFAREAQAVAALNHPGIVTIHSVEQSGDIHFLTMELVDGKTLDALIPAGGLPIDRLLAIAVPLADAVGAAHGQGIVHRDLKPSNVMVTRDGRVKVMDFGLAKLTRRQTFLETKAASLTTMARLTEDGRIFGTVAYMSPEQAEGREVDHRSDVFSLGILLFKLATGRRPFTGESAVAVLASIVKDSPPQVTALKPGLPADFARLVRKCLAKDPARRYQSVLDVRNDLEEIREDLASPTQADGARRTRRTFWLIAGPGLSVLIIGAVAAWALGYVHGGRLAPVGVGIADLTYQRVTFDEGFVFAARFARDGRTIAYSADWDNRRRDVFVTSLDDSLAHGLNFKDADLLALASDSELAILVDSEIIGGDPYARQGFVARASIHGGSPHKELKLVRYADFAPDRSVAVIRQRPGFYQGDFIEWPEGNEIVPASRDRVVFSNLRISPLGKHLAYFICGDKPGCAVRIADKTGKTLAESRRYGSWGLAWSSSGNEVWYSVREGGGVQSVFAMDMTGRERLLFRVPGAFILHDVSKDGLILGSFDQPVRRQEWRESPISPAHDISWREGGTMNDVTPAGVVLFSGGPGQSVYVQDVRAQAADPVRVASGQGLAIDDDGRNVVVSSSTGLSVVPTPGIPQPFDAGPVADIRGANWLKDGRLLVGRSAPTAKPSAFARPPAGGPLTPIFPAGLGTPTPRAVSPDGKKVLLSDGAQRMRICDVPLTGLGTCHALPGDLGEWPAGWSDDSRSVYLYSKDRAPVDIYRVDVTTGRRNHYTTLKSANAALTGVLAVFVTPKGALFYNYARHRSVLYAISGVK
jgi:serine/threonine protein kinase